MEQNPVRGVVSAIAAFVLWGVLPLYWHTINYVPAFEITMHRVGWGFLTAWAVVLWRHAVARGSRSAAVPPAAGYAPSDDPAVGDERLWPPYVVYRWHLLSGLLLLANWLTYIWAVNNGHTLDASLAYYINPLVNVVVGMAIFGERLDRLQWVAVAFAVAGVIYQTIGLGRVPWISLTLAGTFAFFGVVKKRSTLGSIHSMAVELTVVGPIALLFIGLTVVVSGFPAWTGGGSFLVGDGTATGILLGAGVATVTPLFLFGVAARNIRLSDVGFIQYIGPTLMLIIGVAAFGEPLDYRRFPGFVLVWIGLVVYTYSTLRRRNA